MMHTEMRIDGANCPACLNATLDVLRSLPGVRAVDTVSSDGCLAVDHDGTDAGQLTAAIRDELHGVEVYGAELMMVSVDPLVVDCQCHHGS